jgi:hypothetical protein
VRITLLASAKCEGNSLLGEREQQWIAAQPIRRSPGSRKEDIATNLDLTPQFQRRPVWTEEQSSYLIDTILSGLPIPEIYLRSSLTPGGDSGYEVVDGQQRIRSVLTFGSNDLELSGDKIGAKWLGKRFEDLSDSEKTAFWDYKIVVRDVSGASDLSQSPPRGRAEMANHPGQGPSIQ